MLGFPWILRKLHRWLAIVIGFQIMAWVAGGIYFSWTDLGWIHGDHLLSKPDPAIPEAIDLANLASLLAQIQSQTSADRWQSINFIQILDEPVISVRFQVGGKSRIALFSARSGRRIPPLNRKQAEQIAQRAFVPQVPVRRVEFLAKTSRTHEYRGKSLPAFAVTFDYPGAPTVYVAAETGQITAIRHDGWRLFDFLWMLHTLDFKSRDDINNPWLRGLSLAGLIVVFSGYGLFLISHRILSRRAKKIKGKAGSLQGIEASNRPET